MWERLGDLKDGESSQVVTRLFSTYERILEKDPDNTEALRFFKNLENAVDFCQQCNLNRR